MKQPFSPKERKFDLKSMFCGNSGCGKTDLAASYTKGPVHFYMLDKGGEKTIEKKLTTRDKNVPPISVDILSSSDISFSDFWHHIEQDDKDGFFEEMAEQNGLVVFDSITAINKKAIKEVSKVNKINPIDIGKRLDMKKAIAPAYWGQLLSWMTTFISTAQELPCAVIVTAHLHILINSDQEVVARYPYVNGQFRQLMPVDFDECYLLETRGSKHYIHFKENNKFEAKSRVFDMVKTDGKTLDDIANAYINFKTTF